MTSCASAPRDTTSRRPSPVRWRSKRKRCSLCFFYRLAAGSRSVSSLSLAHVQYVALVLDNAQSVRVLVLVGSLCCATRVCRWRNPIVRRAHARQSPERGPRAQRATRDASGDASHFGYGREGGAPAHSLHSDSGARAAAPSASWRLVCARRLAERVPVPRLAGWRPRFPATFARLLPSRAVGTPPHCRCRSRRWHRRRPAAGALSARRLRPEGRRHLQRVALQLAARVHHLC